MLAASRFMAVFIAVALVSGCAKQSVVSNPYRFPARDYDRLYAASIEVLWDYGYRIDRRDHRFGRISTHPLGSPTIAEPWLGQNVTVGRASQSTLQDLQRRVLFFW